jgi:hypothetical protein
MEAIEVKPIRKGPRVAKEEITYESALREELAERFRDIPSLNSPTSLFSTGPDRSSTNRTLMIALHESQYVR